jgi:membrane protease YdiL (CAAX protease family)
MDTSNEHSPARHYVEVAAFVAAWMIFGWWASLDANAYLLLGVPLVLLFQHFVARRPLAALWVRSADRISLSSRDVVVACLLMILPAWMLVTESLPAQDLTVTLWYACAVAGALGVAFSVREQQRKAVLRALPYALAAVLWHGMVLTLTALVQHRAAFPGIYRVLPLLQQFLIYLPLGFILEEVVFRGALDTYLVDSVAPFRRSWRSALYVSALWGLWHVPIFPGSQNAAAATAMVLIHIPIGILLAFTWRRGGTLLLPAAAHAAVDAYRNVLFG